MNRFNWNDTAEELAEHIGKYRSQVERGAVTLVRPRFTLPLMMAQLSATSTSNVVYV